MDTTFTVWLAATLGCAQCHNHKYDEFSQREYYQIYAFFNNTTERATGGESETLSLFLGDECELERHKSEVERLRAMAEPADNSEVFAAQQKWEVETREAITNEPSVTWLTLDPDRLISSAATTLRKQADLSVRATGANPDFDNYTIVADPPTGKLTAIRLELLTHRSHTNGSHSRGENGNTVLTEFEVFVNDSDADTATKVEISGAVADHSQEGHPIGGAIDGNTTSGWSAEGHIRRENCSALFTFASPVEVKRGTSLIVNLKHESRYPRHVIGRFRLSVTESAEVPTLFRPPELRAALAVDPARRNPHQRKLVRKHFIATTPQLAAARAEYQKARQEMDEFTKENSTTTMVMHEGPARSTHVLTRGDFLTKGDEVQPDVPKVYGLSLQEEQRNRLTLARWIVHPDQPLTARVTVNRIWEVMFGQAIVNTSEDFGVQGDLPTHPQLLDWLAADFVQSKWNFKGLLNTIVMSATYQQSSATTLKKLHHDRYNKLLTRGPRFRVEAEMVRDLTLEIAGMLSPKIGGPSVYPPQPDSIWESLFIEAGLKEWPASTGEDRYRRGIYTYYKRTALHPMLRNFDAPNRNVCTVSRQRSNTPLAALNTMNDPAFLEAAAGLAQRMMRIDGQTPDRVTYGFRLCASRPPTSIEQTVLQEFFENALARYKANPQQVDNLINSAFLTPPSQVDNVHLAAWIVVANTLLNMDATLTKG